MQVTQKYDREVEPLTFSVFQRAIVPLIKHAVMSLQLKSMRQKALIDDVNKKAKLMRLIHERQRPLNAIEEKKYRGLTKALKHIRETDADTSVSLKSMSDVVSAMFFKALTLGAFRSDYLIKTKYPVAVLRSIFDMYTMNDEAWHLNLTFNLTNKKKLPHVIKFMTKTMVRYATSNGWIIPETNRPSFKLDIIETVDACVKSCITSGVMSEEEFIARCRELFRKHEALATRPSKCISNQEMLKDCVKLPEIKYKTYHVADADAHAMRLSLISKSTPMRWSTEDDFENEDEAVDLAKRLFSKHVRHLKDITMPWRETNTVAIYLVTKSHVCRPKDLMNLGCNSFMKFSKDFDDAKNLPRIMDIKSGNWATLFVMMRRLRAFSSYSRSLKCSMTNMGVWHTTSNGSVVIAATNPVNKHYVTFVDWLIHKDHDRKAAPSEAELYRFILEEARGLDVSHVADKDLVDWVEKHISELTINHDFLRPYQEATASMRQVFDPAEVAVDAADARSERKPTNLTLTIDPVKFMDSIINFPMMILDKTSGDPVATYTQTGREPTSEELRKTHLQVKMLESIFARDKHKVVKSTSSKVEVFMETKTVVNPSSVPLPDFVLKKPISVTTHAYVFDNKVPVIRKQIEKYSSTNT
jgi:hypothetical protein